MFRTFFVQTWPWWISGPAIGLYVLALLYWQRKPLGASSSFSDLAERAVGKNKSNEIDFTGMEAQDPVVLPVDPREPAPYWRLWMLVGFILGGAVAWIGGGESTGISGLPGMAEILHLSRGHELILLFLGGIFIGVGTRMSGGCTSGHAISGISARQFPSLVATLTFFAVGMATSLMMAWFVGAV